MAEVSRAKSIHLIVTGVILVIISSALFGLLYIIHGDQYEFGESAIFDRKTAFWVVIPVRLYFVVLIYSSLSLILQKQNEQFCPVMSGYRLKLLAFNNCF